MARAQAAHPVYPQPPQFAPGSTCSISSAFLFTGTANIFDARASIIPSAPLIKANQKKAIRTFLISMPHLRQPMLIPVKPEKAMAMRPAVTRAIGIPLNASGHSASSTLCRTPAKMTIASVKPSAAENPKVTE